MRLACPNCDARYEVPDNAIPKGGRDVQCSSCGHAWFQTAAGVPSLQSAAQNAAPAAGLSPDLTAGAAPEAGAELAAAPSAVGRSMAFPEDEADDEDDAALAPPMSDDSADAGAEHAVIHRVGSAIAASGSPASQGNAANAAAGTAESELFPAAVVPDEAAAAAAIARALEDADISDPLPTNMPTKVELAPGVRSILREEAALEHDARRHEAQRNAARRADAESQIQTQPELGVDPPAANGHSAVQRRLAMLRTEGRAPQPEEERASPTATPAAEAEAAPAIAERPLARRDLLPDVEEINSTLQPGDENYDADAAVDALPDLTRSRSFRNGFMLALVALLLASGVYVAADSIAELVPDLKAPLASYVTFVDGLRIWLNDSMDTATKALAPRDGGS